MWEEVTDENGRTYWWNTESDDVSWTKPLKLKEKNHIKIETSISEDRVKLQLIRSQPIDKIVNRIWSQLSEKQKEFNEIEEIFRNNIVNKTFGISIYLLITQYFRYWKDVVYCMKINEAENIAISVARWKEYARYNETFCNALKSKTEENKKLLLELVDVKTKLAQENFYKLSKTT